MRARPTPKVPFGPAGPARPRPDALADPAGRTVAMLGVGGSGMSALAGWLASKGATVLGYDAVESPTTRRLASMGVAVSIGPGEHAAQGADVLVATAAVPADHPALHQAQRLGLPVLTYPQALGAVMRAHTGLAVAGTHGKSTTVAMLGSALVDAGLEPTVIAGAACPHLAHGCLGRPGPWVGSRLGRSSIPQGPLAGRPGLLVAEACEYNRSFHNLQPTLAGITSVEADHLDVYGSLEAIVQAFAQFAASLPSANQGGRLLIAHEGAHRQEVASATDALVQTIGSSPQADWTVRYDPGTAHVRVEHRDGTAGSWTLRMPGAHNAANSAMAFAMACAAGADPRLVERSLGAFTGLERRCQLLGDRPVPGGRVRVYDDYGHHPTEIDATLRAIRQAEQPQAHGGRLVVVFQPHQHSRTRFLLESFACAFQAADVVLVPDIYFVRDSQAERQRVSSQDLVQRLRQRGVEACHLHPFEAIVEHLEHACRPGDVLVVMGAGPVWQVAHAFLGTSEAVAHA